MLFSLRNSERIFRRSILLPAVFLLAIGYTIYQRVRQLQIFLSYGYHNFYITFIQEDQGFAVIYYILFLFLAFEFIYKLKSIHLSEACRTIPGAKPKVYFGQLSFLFLLSLFVTFLHFAFDLSFYLMNPIHSTAVIFHIIQISILNVLLVCIVAILIGTLLGICCNRYSGYVALIGIVLISTPITDSLLQYFSITNPVLYKLKDLFSLMPVNLFTDNVLAGGSIEASRWNVAFFWICLLGAVFLFTQYRKAARKVIALCLSAALVLTAGYQIFSFIPSNDLLITDRVIMDQNSDVFFHAIHPGKEKEANFAIEKYQIDLDLRRGLSADCVLFIDDERGRSEYDFTLSYAYNLHSVTDKQGRPLSYVRDGDYLTVQNPYSSGLSEIHLSYSGNNTTYFVNSQQILLPAYFPYYPFAGFKKLFTSDSVQGALLNTTGENIKGFDISIQSSVPFITNLSEENGRYVGSSEGMSIVGGLLEPVEVKGLPTFRSLVQFFSALSSDVSYVGGIQEELNQLYDYLQVSPSQQLDLRERLIFPPIGVFTSAGFVGNCQVYEDHIFFTHLLSWDNPAKSCAVALLARDLSPTAERTSLQQIFFQNYLLTSAEEFDGAFSDVTAMLEQAVNENQKEFYQIGHLLYELKQRLGEQQAAIAVYNYLCDENDTRTPQQFLEEALA